MNEAVFKTVRIILSVILVISLFVALEFGLLLFKSLIPELTDGIPAPGTFFQFWFGEDGWTLSEYYSFLHTSSVIAFISASLLIIFSLFDKKGRRR